MRCDATFVLQIDENLPSFFSSQCLEYHEIRDKQGEFMLTDPAVEAEVLKDRLRISWPQEGWWDEIKGPNADIPKGW